MRLATEAIRIDRLLDRLEGEIALLMGVDIELDLKQLDRMERTLARGHIRNLERLEGIIEKHGAGEPK